MALIDDRIAQFRAEVGDMELTEEQKKIFNAFTKKNGAATFLNVTDKDGRNVRIKIYSNKTKTGSQHILINHFGTRF